MAAAVTWNDTLVDVFCELCIKEVEKNNRPNTYLNGEGWTNVLTSFHKETGRSYTKKKQLKNKWDALKIVWKLWKELKGKETGLGWDHRLHTIDASDEWWRAKINANKEYAKLRKKGISPEFEDKMDRMFKGTAATGMHAYVPGASLTLSESYTQKYTQEEVEVSSGSEDSVESPKRRKRNSDGKAKGTFTKSRRVGGAALLGQKMDRMCDALDTRCKDDVPSIKDVMKIVRTLPGCEPRSTLFYFASQLFLNKDKREMFGTMEGPEEQAGYLQFEMAKN